MHRDQHICNCRFVVIMIYLLVLLFCSGESGAGKTESTKFVVKQIIELCNGNTQLEQQILQVCETQCTMMYTRPHTL